MTAPVTHGSTDQSVEIRIVDSSDGTPEQSVEHNSTGIALWYRRRGGTKTAITPAALASLDAAHSDGGIEHIDDGYYRLDVPDAAFASGADAVLIGGEVTDMVVIGCLVPLVAAKITGDPYAVVAHTDYGNAKLVRSSTPANALAVDASGKIATPDTQRVDVNTIKTQTITCGAGVTINSAVGQDNKIGTNASGHVLRVVTVDTTTQNTDMRGTDSALTTLGANAPANWINAAAIAASALNGKGDWNTVTPDAAGTANSLITALASHGDSNWVTATGFAVPGDAMTLTADYNAAKTAAPASTALSNATWTDAKAAHLDATITSRLAAASYTAPPTVSQIRTELETDGTKLDHLWETTEDDAGVRRFSTNALEQASVDVGDIEVEVDNDAIAAVVVPAVWSHATRTLTTPAAQLAAGLDGTTLTILRGDTLTVAFTGLGDISTRTKLWFTMKDSAGSMADAKAAIQVEETDGLLYIAEAAATDATKATIAVTDESAGNLTLTVDADQMAMLYLFRDGRYDVQVLKADGSVQTLASGACHVTADVTRAVL